MPIHDGPQHTEPVQDSPAQLEANQWLVDEAHGDPKLLGLLVSREIAIDDAVESGNSDTASQSAVYSAHEAVRRRKEQIGIAPPSDE